MENIFQYFIEFLHHGSIIQMLSFVLMINLLQVAFVHLFGEWLIKIYAHKRVSPLPSKIRTSEIILVLMTILGNTALTMLGYLLWKNGIINIKDGNLITLLFDMVIFILFIDFSMYILHRVAHIDRLFSWLHSTHHIYENPRPITLFVLNPLETLSFGVLWLIILGLYQSSWPGVVVFLTFNLVFGMVGHLGVEPLSNTIFRKIYIKVFSTGTFHAMHHKEMGYNFGFYLVFWDRILKTMHPNYYPYIKTLK